MWQDVDEKIECCSDVITHGRVPSSSRDPGMACVIGSRAMSPVGQIETRNRNVYFELRKFPLKTEIREAPIGERKKVHENEARVSEVRRMWAWADMI